LGYTLPVSVIQKALLNHVRVYASMENLITWDHLNGLPVDPEVINGTSMFNQNTNTGNGYGRTGVGAPMFKNVSFGIQLTF
jgi:hypothetical protein